MPLYVIFVLQEFKDLHHCHDFNF